MGRRKAQAAPASDGAKIGHNSNLNAAEKRKLKGFVDEIERVEGEIKELTTCDAYAHALGDFVTTDLGRAMAPKDSAQA